MSSMNTAQFDKARIRHLLKLGIFAASMVMLGDGASMILRLPEFRWY